MPDAVSLITENIQRLRETVAQAAHACGRRAADVRIIAASKTQPLEAVRAAIAAGQCDFGESTIQDALGKIEPLREAAVTWHFIGHLQSNKARFLPGNFSWLHSLDSIRLASRLSRDAQALETRIQALIEVNITRDPAKHGVLPEEVTPLLDQLLAQALPGIELRGLMCIGPYPASEAAIRAAFAATRALCTACRERYALRDFTELSMGMTGDFAEAIREGATMVRIGSAIFGERRYKKPQG
jgi:pyridoxal phosphate enzyme (YggS family)